MSHFSGVNSENRDPKLGDEWQNWDGKVEADVNSSKTLFLLFATIVLMAIFLFLFLLLYMITPRLNEWNGALPNIFWAIYIMIASFLGLSFCQLLLTVITEKNYCFSKRQGHFLFSIIFSWVFRLSKLTGISRDRMGNSFVKVSNSFTKGLDYSKKAHKLLVLLPRCLTKETIKAVKDLESVYSIDVAVVAGGEAARKRVKELQPTAVIGVACERDLVSGIKDVGCRLSVIGIPNVRPDGPCVNTDIDMKELIKAIEFYVKREAIV